MIAVDKIGSKILFLNPQTYETETVIDGFQRTVHELLVIPETGLAYVPIFGDGIHGRNPNPGHMLCVIDLHEAQACRRYRPSPYSAPHTVRRGADGLIYITCENSAKVAVIDPKDPQDDRRDRLRLDQRPPAWHHADDGQRLYTDNEEDATVSVIDVPNRKLLGKIKTPQALAGIAVIGDGRPWSRSATKQPVIFLIDTDGGSACARSALEGVPKAAQIARYSPDDKLLVISSLNSNMVSLIDDVAGAQTAVPVGSEPMDFAFRGNELFVACQGDGSIHVIDIPSRRHKQSFKAGTGCESVGFF